MLVTDRHAYTATAAWGGDRDDLAEMLDWDILRRNDFARDDSYPDKMERYQAEALAHRHVPPNALLAVGCVSETIKLAVEKHAFDAGLMLERRAKIGSQLPKESETRSKIDARYDSQALGIRI